MPGPPNGLPRRIRYRSACRRRRVSSIKRGTNHKRPPRRPSFFSSVKAYIWGLSVTDLQRLAAQSSLTLSPSPAELIVLAQRLTMVWMAYCVAISDLNATTAPSVTKAWGAAVSEGLRDALSLLVGVEQVGSFFAVPPHDQQRLTLLRLGMQGFSQLTNPDDRAHFEHLLRIAGVLQTGERTTSAALANATFKGAALISALSMLTEALANPPPGGRPATALAVVSGGDNTPEARLSFTHRDPLLFRQALLDSLAPIFEALHHGRKYAVSKYPSGGDGIRVTRSTGPAVTWTRELFRLQSDRDYAPPELARVISSLYAWSVGKPEGFAKCIEIAGRRHRETQRSKASPDFP